MLESLWELLSAVSESYDLLCVSFDVLSVFCTMVSTVKWYQ